jgi:type VI protein secretion system component Hcp
VPTETFIITIEGLLDQPIEAEIAGFSFGSLPAASVNSARSSSRASSKEFTIRKVSDQWSPFIQQSWHTGKEMQITIAAVEPIADDRVKRVIYSFSNAVIKSIQTSGSGAKGMIETLQFDSDGNDLETPVTGIASYKGAHKGKTK